ncbi:MAG TPA: contractile injection system tape measure protein, partial [Myxococcota bacterium]|nr:contractile injection system tape measure protein [Myxococcota bacterium]
MKKHQVYSLEVELLVQEEEAARQLQDRLSRMSGRVERLLDAHFSRHSPEEERLLDRLELDLGVLPEEDFEEAFLAALAEVLDRKLPELPGVQAPSYTPVTGPTGVGMSSPGGEADARGGLMGPRAVAPAAGSGMAPAATPRVATVTALPPAGTPAGSVR